MIRSSKSSLKFTNPGKLGQLNTFVMAYMEFTQSFIDQIWGRDTLEKHPSPEILKSIPTMLTARAQQCAGKQASAIVRGAKAKLNKLRFVQSRLLAEGQIERATEVQRRIDSTRTSKPTATGSHLELDSRFVSIRIDQGTTSFDGWVRLGSYLVGETPIELPVRLTKHMRKLLAEGMSLKSGVRLSPDSVTFLFEKDVAIVDPDDESLGVMGIDLGAATAFSCSDGQSSSKDCHGHDLSSILSRLSRKTKGSKSFKRTQAHRTNYINWALNQIDLSGVKEIVLEDLKDMRRGKSSSRFLSHWCYPEQLRGVGSRCERRGVRVTRIGPAYTSRRCFGCGWTHKSNRKGKRFDCVKCGHANDADMNAAQNIGLRLEMKPWIESPHLRESGFYWMTLEPSQEPIVPDVQRTISS